jgi:hypothetical protein
MEPTVEFPCVMPFTCQVTAVLLVPVTVAVNCCVWRTRTVALKGAMETTIEDEEDVSDEFDELDELEELDELLVPVPPDPPPQEINPATATTARRVPVELPRRLPHRIGRCIPRA